MRTVTERKANPARWLRLLATLLCCWSISIVPIALISEMNPPGDPESILEAVFRLAFGLSFFVAFGLLIVLAHRALRRADQRGMQTGRLKLFCWIFGPFGCLYTVFQLSGEPKPSDTN